MLQGNKGSKQLSSEKKKEMTQVNNYHTAMFYFIRQHF